MGKFLVKLGLKIQAWWCLFQCYWNKIVSKLMFDVEFCPHKLCKCNKKVKMPKPTNMKAKK